VPEAIGMPAPNDRKTQMLDLVRRWRDSGRSARVFAQEQGVTPWTLYYWRERLTQEVRPKTRRTPRSSRRLPLAPVHVPPSGEDRGSDLEISFANGDRIRVPSTIAADTLRHIIQIVRPMC
jgi:hypothetical protein